MTDVHLYKDYRLSEQTHTYWVCKHPTSLIMPLPDLVTGAPRRSYPELVRERADRWPSHRYVGAGWGALGGARNEQTG
jgi:hypothetical protein